MGAGSQSCVKRCVLTRDLLAGQEYLADGNHADSAARHAATAGAQRAGHGQHFYRRTIFQQAVYLAYGADGDAVFDRPADSLAVR